MRARISLLWIAAWVAGGCAVERLDAIDRIDSGTDAAGGTGIEASPGDATDAGTVAPACTDPVFVTSKPDGIWSNGGYFVFNNVWDTDAGPGLQTLDACSYHAFYVVSDQTDNVAAVKSYPNVQMNFNELPIGSFHLVTSTFAERGPHVGIYEFAYDVWLNGVATPGSAQIMIWVDNYKRVPTGSQVTTIALGGRSYDVWKTSDDAYVALVTTATFTSGTIDLLEIFDWVIAQGWLPASTTLGQIDFGVEIESTGAASATFEVDDFSIVTN